MLNLDTPLLDVQVVKNSRANLERSICSQNYFLIRKSYFTATAVWSKFKESEIAVRIIKDIFIIKTIKEWINFISERVHSGKLQRQSSTVPFSMHLSVEKADLDKQSCKNGRSVDLSLGTAAKIDRDWMESLSNEILFETFLMGLLISLIPVLSKQLQQKKLDTSTGFELRSLTYAASTLDHHKAQLRVS